MSKFWVAVKAAAVLIAAYAFFIACSGGIMGAAGADTSVSDASFARIDDQSCGFPSGAITTSGVAPRSGNYAISVLSENGRFFPVANGYFTAGELVNLRSSDELVEGETIGVVLTVSDLAASDDSATPVELERKMVTRPSQTFCEAAIVP